MTAHLSKSPNDASLVYVMVEHCYFAAYELCCACAVYAVHAVSAVVCGTIVQHRV